MWPKGYCKGKDKKDGQPGIGLARPCISPIYIKDNNDKKKEKILNAFFLDNSDCGVPETPVGARVIPQNASTVLYRSAVSTKNY
jgi:hypothetical protein